MYNKILVPLDGSKISEEVLPVAQTLAEMNHSEIILSRVVEYPYSLYPECYEYPPSDPDTLSRINQKKSALSYEVEACLKQIGTAMQKSGIKVTADICDGPVVESILASIDRLQVDLVVLATHSENGNDQGTIGAVANRVLRESPVPVILVRPSSSPYRVSDLPWVGLA